MRTRPFPPTRWPLAVLAAGALALVATVAPSAPPGDLEAEIAELRQELAVDATNGAAHYELGRRLLQLDRPREARRELVEALRFDPTHAAAAFYLGVAESAQGRFRSSRRAFRRAFALDPRLADPLRNPDVVGNRQALAAQLEAWAAEEPVAPMHVAEASVPTAAPRSSASPPDPASGGGVVRSLSGAPPRDLDESGRAGNDGDGDTVAGPPPSARPRDDPRAPAPVSGFVLDAGNVRSTRVVNQAGASERDDPGSSSRKSPRTGRAAPGRTGRSTPFTPAPRAAPFTPQPDSTGRLEISIEPPAFAGATAGR